MGAGEGLPPAQEELEDENAGINDHRNCGVVDPLSAEHIEPLPPPRPRPSSRRVLARKLLLLLPLLFSLSMLADTKYYNETRPPKRHHLAFVTALARHPPSLRVFRIVSEGAFLLLCTAFSLWVWEGGGGCADEEAGGGDEPSQAVGNVQDAGTTRRAVGRLLFAPPPDVTANAAWVAYRTHASLRRRNKQKRSFENDGVKSESDAKDTVDINTIRVPNHDKQAVAERENDDECPLPPTPASVLGAAMDVFTVMCVFLIFFTISSAEGGRYIEEGAPETWMNIVAGIAAPLFPLTLFIAAVLAVTLPWRRRRAAYAIVSLTVGAPFYEVTFRDGFVGDILTSIVRPLQDLAFTLFFLPFGLKAFWDQDLYTTDAASVPWERSWLLHTVVLPACTLSPLWWRFLQNLRQCYDARRRWPYLGNALKYFLAAEIATFGVYAPSVKTSPLWIACFFVATLYQIWWDVFMDWGLLERGPRDRHLGTIDDGGRQAWSWLWPYSLRSRRLYRSKWMYHAIFGINFGLRFVGMITLIPPRYLSRSTGLIVNAYHDPDFQLFIGSLFACLEIFRRCLWALLRVEWEVINTSSPERDLLTLDRDRGNCNRRLDEEDMKPMSIVSSEEVGTVPREHWRAWSSTVKGMFSFISLSDMNHLNDIQILSELSVWATIFSGIAMVAAAHREVL